jgi:hypothetical protein
MTELDNDTNRRITRQKLYVGYEDDRLYEGFRRLFDFEKDENILHICKTRGCDFQQDISIEKDTRNDRLFDNMCPGFQLAYPDVRYTTKQENLCTQAKVLELKVEIQRPQMTRKRAVVVLQLHLRK